jgi:N-acetylmuramic acid 6-phosphate etherase
LRRGEASRWAGLATERRNPRSRRLDALPTERVVALVLEEDRRALSAALRMRRDVARAATLAARTLAGGGRLVLAGAGTSGRLAILEAAECPPTFGTRPTQVRGVMAGGARAVFRAVEGAEDRRDAGVRVGQKLHRGDLLIGISASSVTPYVRGALAGARARRAAVVLVTCARRKGLRSLADVVIAIPTGAELLTGSTRLKAGSATKAVLNAITTAAMVRLGKAYENLMVDLKQGSAKLVDRARRIVVAAARVPPAEAVRLLESAGGEVKVAIVMGLLSLSPAGARRRLVTAGGHVHRAVRGSRRPRRSGSRGPIRIRAG